MATGDVKTFTFDYGTLKFKVTATDNGNGTVKFAITCLSGSADVNALYLDNGDPDAVIFNLGGSLNMNGTGD